MQKITANGTADETQNFNEIDDQPAKGENFYHLQLVYTDGSVAFSNVEKLQFPIFAGVGIFPNQASDNVVVALGDFSKSAATVQLVNGLGKIVLEKTATPGTETLSIEI